MASSISQFIFDRAAIGVLVFDADQRLIQLNPAAAAMLQLSPERALRQPARAILPEHLALLRLIEGSRKMEVPLPHHRLAHGIAEDVEGGRVVLLHDVTERYDLESRREALIRAIAHDLRNPINGITGYAELVAKFGDLNPQQQKFLQRIQQTSSKIYELTAKLVDQAWMESGMPLEHVPVELMKLTREALWELSYAARRQQVSLVNSIPDETPMVMGDPKRLKQVVYNLLDNAIRYSLTGGNVVIHAWHQGEMVHYTVADQGIGIASDEQDKVWDRMWRSSDPRVRDIPGGGIGLTYVRTVIRRHGGDISMESRLGNGSTFSFFLPLARTR